MSQQQPQKCDLCPSVNGPGGAMLATHRLSLSGEGILGRMNMGVCCRCFCKLKGGMFVQICRPGYPCYDETPLARRTAMPFEHCMDRITFRGTDVGVHAARQFEHELTRIINEETAPLKAKIAELEKATAKGESAEARQVHATPIALRIKMRQEINADRVAFMSHPNSSDTAVAQFETGLRRIIDEETAKVRAERDEALRQLQTFQARAKDLEMQLEARPKSSAQFWVVLHDESTGKERSLGPFDFLEAPCEAAETYCAISGKCGLTEKELIAVHRPPYSEGLGSRKRAWIDARNGSQEFTRVRITTQAPKEESK